MTESAWQWWPWISLFIYALLMSIVFRLIRGYNPFYVEHSDPGVVAVWIMLIISLIVSAAIITLFINYWI